MGDAGEEIGTKGALEEVEAETKAGQTVVTAMANLAQAMDHWQQAVSFANKKRHDIEKQSANLVKKMNNKIKAMEKRLEEGLVQTSCGKKVIKLGPGMQRSSTPQMRPVALNQGTSSLQRRPPAVAGSSSGVKRSGSSFADSSSFAATPTKHQRTIQDDVTPGKHFLVSDPQTSSNPPPSRLQPHEVSLLSAVKTGKTGICLSLLDLGVNPSFKDKEGNTLLHLAAKANNIKMLEAFLENEHMQVDAEDSSGQTALHVAASIQNGEGCFNILLASSADVNKRDYKGDTPLHCAAKNGNVKLVRKLLRNPTILIVANNEGEKPVDVAKDEETRRVLENINETSASTDEDLDPTIFLEESAY